MLKGGFMGDIQETINRGAENVSSHIFMDDVQTLEIIKSELSKLVDELKPKLTEGEFFALSFFKTRLDPEKDEDELEVVKIIEKYFGKLAVINKQTIIDGTWSE